MMRSILSDYDDLYDGKSNRFFGYSCTIDVVAS
jgi:hypothetical protein